MKLINFTYTILILTVSSNLTPIYSSNNFIDDQIAQTNEESTTISHLRHNVMTYNSDEDRRLSWWLLFWNALHPHLPCPPHCHDHGNCPPHCNIDSSGGSGGDGNDSNGNGAGDDGESSGYYSNMDDLAGGNDDESNGDDASGGGGGGSGGGGGGSGGGGGGGGSYYSGGSGSNSNSAGSSSTEEGTVSSLNSNKGYLALLCAGVAAAGAIAAVALGQRRGESQKPHPLQGSLGRRMMLFSGLANKNILSKNRPERVVEIAERDSDDSGVDYVRC